MADIIGGRGKTGSVARANKLALERKAGKALALKKRREREAKARKLARERKTGSAKARLAAEMRRRRKKNAR